MKILSTRIASLCMVAAAGLSATAANAIVATPVVTPSESLTFKFDFNSIALPLKTSTVSSLQGYGIGNIGLSDNIGLAMTTALGTIAKGATVTVSGGVATQTYSGEGRVVGNTLGNSDGGVKNLNLKLDTFIVNNNFRAVQDTATLAKQGTVTNPDRFTLAFNGFTVTSVAFDYEIFPDALCKKGSGCGPDMSLLTDGVQRWLKTTPTSNSIDPQALGTTEKISFYGASLLSFVDWPSEVGIDNLVITGCVTSVNGACAPSNVPEPVSLALFGVGLLGVSVFRRRKANRV